MWVTKKLLFEAESIVPEVVRSATEFQNYFTDC